MPKPSKPKAASVALWFLVLDDELCYSDDGATWTPAGGLPADERARYQEAIQAAWSTWREKTTRRP